MVWDSAIKDLEDYLTPEQIQIILQHTKNTRDYMLIYLGWKTGRRSGEIVPLKKKDIDFHKGIIKFKILKKFPIRKADTPEQIDQKVRQKSHNYKLKAVDKETLEQLERYSSHMDWDAYLFPSPYNPGRHITTRQFRNIIKDAALRAIGTDKCHPHMLRHSFAINFLRKCKTPSIAIKILQMLLEHSNINMTSGYLQFSQEDIRKELDHVFRKEV